MIAPTLIRELMATQTEAFVVVVPSVVGVPEVDQGSGHRRAMAPEDPAFDLEARALHAALDERRAFRSARLVEGTRGFGRRRLVVVRAVRRRRRLPTGRGGKQSPRRLGFFDAEEQ